MNALERAILGVAASCLFWQGTQLIAEQPRRTPVFVGVLRADGLLVPIAIHDGTEWWNRWPFSYESDESIARVTLPSSVDRIPSDWLPPGVRLPETWRVQVSAGGNITVRLHTPTRSRSPGLAAFVGLSTNYRVQPSVDRSMMSDSDVGVAIVGDAALGRFTPATAAESKGIVAAIANDLQRAESEEITFRLKERQSQPDSDSRSLPPSMASKEHPLIAKNSFGAVRAERKERGRRFFFVGGQKEYGVKPWPDCDATVDFSGIVVRDSSGAINARSVGAYTTFGCTRDNSGAMGFQPLASLHWHGPTLWVVRLHAEDGFEYGLIDPSATDPRTMLLKGLWQMRDR